MTEGSAIRHCPTDQISTFTPERDAGVPGHARQRNAILEMGPEHGKAGRGLPPPLRTQGREGCFHPVPRHRGLLVLVRRPQDGCPQGDRSADAPTRASRALQNQADQRLTEMVRWTHH
jgi:hypothetical protein